MKVLEVKNLSVGYKSLVGKFRVLHNVTFSVESGEIIGIVGESGSGKSTLGHSIIRLLPPNAYFEGGEILFQGKDITKIPEKEMVSIRGNGIFMIFQNPLNSLNPVKTVEYQLLEAVRVKASRDGKNFDEKEAREIILNAVKDVRLPDPEEIIKKYPHQLSGGQVQRVVIAMALILRPKILIADEPTSALDVTIQAQVVKLFKQLREEEGISILFISHDISLVYAIADRIIVMYAGRIMEDGNIEEVIKNPMHPYTQGLISSIPTISKKEGELRVIEGSPPSFLVLPTGCKFHPRCNKVMDICRNKEPELKEINNRRVRCWLYE
ncbi:ABC transporter ATP-binding protein [Sulfurisphaera ohwakuensis]|uniref:ATP-binding cassette domain-containing protein n=1 Tax=Sulfurisphaera ohwakuensis TaxID=69656 RepID=A0A650CK56_SULOH|nr:ABC transporter ATP-binding protein [Sulfurisphaera ohwakuensis]MBB5254528.1 peptide/nickel transport system ATP-binding protein [Sulfurisphaera ohwakuensis]QGR18138.1 ATP-binding cassette domain-containing protein [Sulfurisphaera ohwakuensis]